MKAALPRSATGEEFQEGKLCGIASDVCFRGRGGMMKQGAGAADRLFTPVMIYCFLEGRKDMVVSYTHLDVYKRQRLIICHTE